MFRYIRQLVQKLKKDTKVETQHPSSHSDGNTHVVRRYKSVNEKAVFIYNVTIFLTLLFYYIFLLTALLLYVSVVLYMLNIIEIIV